MISEYTRYCPHCTVEHIVSETFDAGRTKVGYFCNRKGLMTESFGGSAIWNGEDLTAEIARYCRQSIDTDRLSTLPSERLISVSKRIAFAYINHPTNAHRAINFAFAVFHVNGHVSAIKAAE
jgi:hypothetical protein